MTHELGMEWLTQNGDLFFGTIKIIKKSVFSD